VLNPEDGAPWNVVRPTPDVAVLVTRSLGGSERTSQLARDFKDYFDVLSPWTASGERLTVEQAEHIVVTVVEAMHRMTGQPQAGPRLGGAARAEDDLHDLGARLYRIGLGSRDLRAMGHALVRSVRNGVEPSAWTTGVGSAWASAQSWLVTALVSGAQREAILVDRARQKTLTQARPGWTSARAMHLRRGK
jgi:hypothetical protein